MKVIGKMGKTIDLSGIDDHTVRNLTIVSAGGVTRTPMGEILVIVHQAADMTRESKTILSAGQLEAFGCKIDDRSPTVTQQTPCLTTAEGYKVPITFRKGLPYIRLRPFNQRDWDNLPHILLTSSNDWDPTILDSEVPETSSAIVTVYYLLCMVLQSRVITSNS